MITLISGTKGPDGVDGIKGVNSPDLTIPSGDGGNGGAGGAGGDVVLALTPEDAVAGNDFRIYGGYAGNGGDGAYSGDIFSNLVDVRTGDAEVQNYYFSAAGGGGDAGRGGDGGSTDLKASGLTFSDGITLMSTSTNGGYGGQGGNGGAGATDIHNIYAAWQTFVDENLVQHTVSLDYTSHGAPGGPGGRGGDGGDAGTAQIDFRSNIVHGNVWLAAQGGAGGFGWQGGGGGAGNDPATGGLGGNGGEGGDANLTVNGNAFDFASNITFTAWGGTGGLGGVGGNGGYGDTAEGVEGVYDQTYTYAMGAPGGNGGGAGAGHAAITDNKFVGGNFSDQLTLSIQINSGASGDGGRGGAGAGVGDLNEAHTYDAASGISGSYGASTLLFDGNLLDGMGGDDTLELLINNVTGQVSNDGTGLNPLPALDINLSTRTMLVGAGVNTIDNIENVSVYYSNGYYDDNHNLVTFGDVTLTGSDNNNVLTTGNGNDTINGGDGADNLHAGAGNDVMNGGAGADQMFGGLGNDTYYVDDSSDSIYETPTGGLDIVMASATFSLAGQNIENLLLTGDSSIDGTGNSLDNVIKGNSGSNILNGGSGNDVIDGGAGADQMIGWYGNDTFYVDNAGDLARDGANAGTDLVIASVSYSLAGQNIENLTLSGSADINANGNSLDNILTGNDGSNVLYGGAGNDVLDGGAGVDTMIGWFGDDTYYVDNVGDFVREGANAGTDLVIASVSYSLAGQNIENLTLSGSDNIDGNGNSLDNVLTGNSGANVLYSGAGNDILDGGAGADTMIGWFGDDTYYVDNIGDYVREGANAGTDLVIASVSYSLAGQNIENLTLTGSDDINAAGNSLANILTGNIKNNLLTGGLGSDTFTFLANSGHDTITDFSPGQNDSIRLMDYTSAAVTQSGSDVIVDMGNGNYITVLNANTTDVNAHLVFG